ncbi:hypothetical protein [Halochromatium roseum]|uniref:hypothetical protein n=1 Tax=Halochromatium roseum TaxID=391920 RepID=UPI00191152CC|nr:hypothetical protein [Halochromatium roseum]MBK5938932.1 hypothetical protein [Halochromatium roseum]
MYKEVAFDPRCMADIEYYNLVKQHFGFEKGRYISAEIKSWAREAMTHVKESDLKTIRKQSVKNYLNKLGRSKTSEEFLLTRDRQGVAANCWQDWAEAQRKIRGFSCIVSDGSGEDRIDIDQVNEGCGEWNVPASISVDRSDPKSIVEGILTLLVLSDCVTIVDQFFRLAGNAVLVELFKAIPNTSVRCLRIATAMETCGIEDVYDREFRSMHANVRFEWIKAPDRYFHDRYVITEVGAVRSGHGFMTDVKKGTHADLANINIVARDEAHRTLAELDQLLEAGKATLELSR